ncbi:MAG: hypothetical protein K6G26_07810 [Lachnospiraceae bacterium]|nr:hypothetical protein [Lachnospiraceae bacterium]
MAVNKDTKLIDQVEVPSKTDVIKKLQERMKENQKMMGDRAGTRKILEIGE